MRIHPQSQVSQSFSFVFKEIVYLRVLVHEGKENFVKGHSKPGESAEASLANEEIFIPIIPTFQIEAFKKYFR